MERKLDWSVVSTIKWSRIPLSSYTFFLRLLLTSADMNLIEGCNVNVSSGERNAPNYDWHHRLVSFDMHKQEISFLSFALFFVLWVVFKRNAFLNDTIIRNLVANHANLPCTTIHVRRVMAYPRT